MTDQQVTAILVAYNSHGVIAKALMPLLCDGSVAEIIVVDNCSHDDTCEMIQREFPEVTVIENPRNDGFGRANNIALAKVKTPYALLVNPDAVMGHGAIAELLAAASRYPEAAILAPSLYDEKGELHRSHKRSVFGREKDRDSYIEPEGDCCADFLSGAVWLVDMKLMREIGFFDPNLFLYYEDDDLCMRAHKLNHGPVLVPAARATHLVGASSGGHNPDTEFFKQQQMTWSRLYIERKYRGQMAARKLASRLERGYALRAAFYLLTLNFSKLNRYRGRLKGVSEWTLDPANRK